MKKKLTRALIAACIVAIIAGWVLIQFTNPTLTQAQLLIQFWKDYLVSVVLLILCILALKNEND